VDKRKPAIGVGRGDAVREVALPNEYVLHIDATRRDIAEDGRGRSVREHPESSFTRRRIAGVESGERVEEEKRAVRAVFMKQPRRDSLINAQFCQVARNISLHDGAKEENERIPADEVPRLERCDVTYDWIVRQKETAHGACELGPV